MNDILKYLSVETKIAIAVDLWDELDSYSLSQVAYDLYHELLDIFDTLNYDVHWVVDVDGVSQLTVTIPGEGIPI